MLAVGRLEEQKNFHDLLYSAKETGFKIDIYGEGILKQDLLNLSKSLNIKLRIYDNIENDIVFNFNNGTIQSNIINKSFIISNYYSFL